jgi:heterodisulfide reductase subunit A-like polyferredoxin
LNAPTSPRILYCNCSYAQVVPKEVKEEVLRKLCESGAAFDAVADLCDMSARKDPALQKLVERGAVRIAACYPRAVRWLFHAAGAPLPKEGVEVLNMREQPAGAVVGALFGATGKQAAP